jgi:hypothetical protein
MEGPGFARQPLRSPDHLIGSSFRSAPGLALSATSNRGPNSGLFFTSENGLFAALSLHARTFVQKQLIGINFFPEG